MMDFLTDQGHPPDISNTDIILAKFPKGRQEAEYTLLLKHNLYACISISQVYRLHSYYLTFHHLVQFLIKGKGHSVQIKQIQKLYLTIVYTVAQLATCLNIPVILPPSQ